MRILRLIALCLLAAAPAAAQDGAEEDKTFLEGWIEGALSGAGREVTISGFEGALSSNATLERMTIADDSGIWFTMEEASLVWSRSALLQGRLDVTELTAERITLSRLPAGEDGLSPEDSQATAFSLPELPVAIDIDQIKAARVRLGAEVLGEPAVLSLESSLSLAEGAGAARLAIRRLGRDDRLTLDAAFSNATRVLDIDLDFDEAEDGLVSRVLRIPGQPQLRLQVEGRAPISDFTAQVALSSDGVRRFGGTAQIRESAPDAEGTEGAAPGYAFSTDLSGDLRPLFAPDLHPFFGETAALDISGTTFPDGALRLDRLRLETGAMVVTGEAALAPDGWPRDIALEGRISGDGPVRLPVAQPLTTLRMAEFTARYDAGEGEAWRAEIALSGLDSGPLHADFARLGGTGTIARGVDQTLIADLGFRASGVAHDNPAQARALGPAPEGRLQFSWQPGEPVAVELFSVSSGNAALTASGRLEGLEQGFPIEGRAAIRAADLSRFAALAGRDIAGAANATLSGSGHLLGGAFDIELAASATDLRTGTPRLDPALPGRTTLTLAARRTEAGTFLDSATLDGEVLRAEAAGRIDAAQGALDLTATLDKLSLVEPGLTGPAEIDTRIGWQADGTLSIAHLRARALDATLEAQGRIATANPALPAQGQARLAAQDLSRLSALAGHPLAGTATLSIDGAGEIRGRALDAAVTLDASNLRTGIAALDSVTAGTVDFNADLGLGTKGPAIGRLSLETPRLSVSADSDTPGGPVTLTARLADLGVLAPGLSGPARLSGRLVPQGAAGEVTQVDLGLDGPGGMTAQIAGQVRDFGQSLALSIDGNAPLGLANPFIAPRSVQGPARFDLRLDGPPALSSLSGRIGLSGARLALPRLKAALSDLTGAVTLSGGQARADITGNAGIGGSFRLTGPVALSPPFDAGLEVVFNRLGVRDPGLYDTTLDGRLTMTGPLAGGARIGGAVMLGRTELRIPSGGGVASVADIPPITHVNEPADVRRSRRRAGLIETGNPGAAVAYPLDLVVNAPNRIFVRGRGLDAELGGALRLGGTTADVTASGTFELVRGRMDILSKRLELTEGLIDLRGSLDPYLRFVAQSETDDFTVRIVLEGLASDPDISFTSTPELPQEEIIAQLLFGKGFSQMSAFQAAQLVSAVATLSGRGSGGLTGNIRDALGVSDIDITTTDEGATEFSVGSYITDNIYSEVSADSEGNNEINLNLDITSSVTVKGSAGSDGNTGLGIYYEKDY